MTQKSYEELKQELLKRGFITKTYTNHMIREKLNNVSHEGWLIKWLSDRVWFKKRD